MDKNNATSTNTVSSEQRINHGKEHIKKQNMINDLMNGYEFGQIILSYTILRVLSKLPKSVQTKNRYNILSEFQEESNIVTIIKNNIKTLELREV